MTGNQLKSRNIKENTGYKKKKNQIQLCMTKLNKMVIYTDESTDSITWKVGRKIVELCSLEKALNIFLMSKLHVQAESTQR